MRYAASRRVRFAARGLVAACVGDVRFEGDPELEGEICLRRGCAAVARVYDEAADAEPRGRKT